MGRLDGRGNEASNPDSRRQDHSSAFSNSRTNGREDQALDEEWQRFVNTSRGQVPDPQSAIRLSTQREAVGDVIVTVRSSVCCICFDKVQSGESFARAPETSDCDHIFHWECMRKWLMEKPTCPVCVRSLQTTGIYEVDMNTGTETLHSFVPISMSVTMVVDVLSANAQPIDRQQLVAALTAGSQRRTGSGEERDRRLVMSVDVEAASSEGQRQAVAPALAPAPQAGGSGAGGPSSVAGALADIDLATVIASAFDRHQQHLSQQLSNGDGDSGARSRRRPLDGDRRTRRRGGQQGSHASSSQEQGSHASSFQQGVAFGESLSRANRFRLGESVVEAQAEALAAALGTIQQMAGLPSQAQGQGVRRVTAADAGRALGTAIAERRQQRATAATTRPLAVGDTANSNSRVQVGAEHETSRDNSRTGGEHERSSPKRAARARNEDAKGRGKGKASTEVTSSQKGGKGKGNSNSRTQAQRRASEQQASSSSAAEREWQWSSTDWAEDGEWYPRHRHGRGQNRVVNGPMVRDSDDRWWEYQDGWQRQSGWQHGRSTRGWNSNNRWSSDNSSGAHRGSRYSGNSAWESYPGSSLDVGSSNSAWANHAEVASEESNRGPTRRQLNRIERDLRDLAQDINSDPLDNTAERRNGRGRGGVGGYSRSGRRRGTFIGESESQALEQSPSDDTGRRRLFQSGVQRGGQPGFTLPGFLDSDGRAGNNSLAQLYRQLLAHQAARELPLQRLVMDALASNAGASGVRVDPPRVMFVMSSTGNSNIDEDIQRVDRRPAEQTLLGNESLSPQRRRASSLGSSPISGSGAPRATLAQTPAQVAQVSVGLVTRTRLGLRRMEARPLTHSFTLSDD